MMKLFTAVIGAASLALAVGFGISGDAASAGMFTFCGVIFLCAFTLFEYSE